MLLRLNSNLNFPYKICLQLDSCAVCSASEHFGKHVRHGKVSTQIACWANSSTRSIHTLQSIELRHGHAAGKKIASDCRWPGLLMRSRYALARNLPFRRSNFKMFQAGELNINPLVGWRTDTRAAAALNLPAAELPKPEGALAEFRNSEACPSAFPFESYGTN